MRSSQAGTWSVRASSLEKRNRRFRRRERGEKATTGGDTKPSFTDMSVKSTVPTAAGTLLLRKASKSTGHAANDCRVHHQLHRHRYLYFLWHRRPYETAPAASHELRKPQCNPITLSGQLIFSFSASRNAPLVHNSIATIT